MPRTFVGFGFGPIQSALFLLEAWRSGSFDRFVVADVDADLVGAVRRAKGVYTVNVASPEGVTTHSPGGIEIHDTRTAEGRAAIVSAIAEAREAAVALPSVNFYDRGGEASVAALLAAGLRQRDPGDSLLVYAAENDTEAANLLTAAVGRHLDPARMAGFEAIDTVIGKMSGIITDDGTIKHLGLATMTPDLPRAVLVEEFNRILVSRPTRHARPPGIDVFLQKDDLEPFEEAKLYGHNATHALLAYFADLHGYRVVSEVTRSPELMDKACRAFLEESGRTLVARHAGLGDPLFTDEGYREYADDLLRRMTNPYLNDLVDRVGRDPVRKLGYRDRLYGTMRLALEQGVEPRLYAEGAAAGLLFLVRRWGDQPHTENLERPHGVDDLTPEKVEGLLRGIWGKEADERAGELIRLTVDALARLRAVYTL